MSGSIEKQRSRPGQAGVINGEIKVTDPTPGEDPAVIVPGEGLKLLVNGTPVEKEAEVTSADKIEVQAEKETVPGHVKVNVSEDRMKASLQIDPAVEKTYEPKDSLPARRLTLSAEKKQREYIPYTFEEVMEVIKRYELAKVEEEAVKKALTTENYDEIIISTGVPPTEPWDEWLEFKVQGETSQKPVLKPDGRIDFRESISNINSVDSGEIIAVKHAAVPGSPGTDVYGREVQPRVPEEVIITPGKGIQLTDGDTKVIAISPGKPEIKHSGNEYHISIQTNYTHEGNVDINSGNIRFKGNVEVKGNVEQGMVVSGTQKVLIKGMINMATVTAGEELDIRGHVMASRVEAGASLSAVKKLTSHLEQLQEMLSQLQVATSQTYSSLKEKAPLGKIIALLVDRKFPSIPRSAKEINNLVNQQQSLPPQLEQLAADLYYKLWGVNVLQLNSIEELKDLADRASETHSYLKILLKNPAVIHLKYCLNSKVETTGNIYVIGQGCIDSILNAGDSIYVDGIFRGGNIYAGGSVTVKEVGSKVGAITTIKVPEDQSIFIGKAYENVTLYIGDQHIRLNNNLINKEARLDVYDAIEFVDWTPSNK